MSLNSFFKTYKNKKLSDKDKLRIYEIFAKNKQRSHGILNRRFSFSVRFLTSLVLCIFILSYAIFYYQYTDNQKNLGILSDITRAQDVWTITNAQWYFEITNNQGRKIITDTLSNNDRISLDTNSYLSFNINDSLQATIAGPANFSLKHNNKLIDKENYHISLLKWDYLALQWKKNKTTNPLSIDINQSLSITSNNASTTSLIYGRQNNTTVIINKWNNLIITDNKNKDEEHLLKRNAIIIFNNWLTTTQKIQSENTSQLSNHFEYIELLSPEYIFTEISTIIESLDNNTSTTWKDIQKTTQNNNTSSSSQTSKSMNTNTISQIEQQPSKSSSYQKEQDIDTMETQTWNSHNTGSTTDFSNNNRKLVPQIHTNNIWDQRILTEDKLYKLEQNLIKSFVMKDIKTLIKYRIIKGNWQWYTIAIANLMSRIHRIYNIFDYNTPHQNTSLKAISRNLDIIILLLQKKFIIPSQIKHNLTAIEQWIKTIEELPQWLYSQDELENLSFEELIKKLDINITSSMKIK